MSRLKNWTVDQREAITSTGKSLLVSAAAGSGKTAVLAERCAYLICDIKDPCSIDQILVATFTETAAAEMKSRIADALRERLAFKPSEHLRRQVALVEHAYVGTVHGFCARILRQNFHQLGLDPNFQIIDPDEAALLRAQTATDLFEQRYEDDSSGDFHRLIDAYGDGDDEQLIHQVVATHDLLCSLRDPKGWSGQAMAELSEAVDQPPAKSVLGQQLLDQVEENLEQLQRQCEQAIAIIKPLGGFASYVDQLQGLQGALRHWQAVYQSDGLDALAEIRNDYQPPRAPSIAASVPNKELAKSILDSVKQRMGEGPLTDLLAAANGPWRDRLRQTLPHAQAYLSLVSDFGDAYTEAKKAVHGLDFADLERMALHVLQDQTSAILRPSPLALAYQNQFRHVLVDEYQDINEIQDAILTLLSRESVAETEDVKANLFCVGDVKQSIFRFRLAEPERFRDRYKRFSKPDNRVGKVIPLRANFRSRDKLIAALNAVFERLMTEQIQKMPYDESQRLSAGADYPTLETPNTFHGSPIELHLLPNKIESENSEPDESPDDLERADYEAKLLARRIRQIVGHDDSPPMQVMKKDADGKYHPVPAQYSDIVILLRAMKYKADHFADILRQHDIPVHSEGGSGFFEAQEVRDILCLLCILDNEKQDIPLAALLRSPLARLPDPENALARIRLAYAPAPNPVPFHEAARKYSATNDELGAFLRDFFTRLDDWRDQARKRPVAELIWQIYDQTGYLAFCSGLLDGAQRVANLLYLHQRAQQFGAFLRQGLFRFLQFLQNLREQLDLGRPSVASSAESVVRIMSIHRAKGLEFPIVLLPDLGKKHNLQDAEGAILVDRELKLALAVVEQERQIRYPSFPWALAQNRLLADTLGEEIRLLYVALTRAREHLILVGTCPPAKADQWQSIWKNRPGELPIDVLLQGKTFLDWLGPVAAMTEQAGIFQVRRYTAEEVSAWPAPAGRRRPTSVLRERLSRLQPLEPPPPVHPHAVAIIETFAARYPFEPYAHLRAAMAATELAGHGPAATPSSALPAFLSGDPSISAADRGTITHLVLQHLDFTSPCDATNIQRQIDQMVERRFLTGHEAAVVDRPALAWAAAELAPLLHGGSVQRELAFAVMEDSSNSGADILDRLMIRGRIDLLIDRGDGAVVVDYKTDDVAGERLDQRVEIYRGQMKIYREAIQKIAGKPVTEIYLLFLTPRKIVRI